jgi:beta-lactamase class A
VDARLTANLTWRKPRGTSRRGALRTLASSVALAAFNQKLAHAQGTTPVVATDWAAVEMLVLDAEGTDGIVGVAVYDADGERFARHGDRRFRAASTIKIPIMIEAYRQIEQGTLSLNDRILLREEDFVPGSGVLAHLQPGLELTLADLITLMIAVSDNTATNLILDRTGLDAVNATLQALGMSNSVLGRRILGRLPAPGDPENWATPRDFALAVQAIVAGEAARPESCAAMLAALEQQGEIRRISRFLTGPGLRWGTKPGDLPGVINDVGFVSSDAGTLSIAVFTENLPDLDAAERAIGLISREALALTGIVPFAPDSAVASS